MPQVIKCKCHNPALNLFILPMLTTDNQAFAAVCPAKPPTVHIKEDGEWEKKEGWKIENGQILQNNGEQFQLPESTQVLPATQEESPSQEHDEPRPAGRKPARGTRVDLSRDDYF